MKSHLQSLKSSVLHRFSRAPKPEVSFPFIPPLALDYNTSAKDTVLQKREYDYFSLKILPFLLKVYGEQKGHTGNGLRFFDMGCGFGKLAYALRSFVEVSDKNIFYTGLDIRPDAIAWCQQAYQKYGFQFVEHRTEKVVDYVGAVHQSHSTLAQSDGEEGNYQLNGLYDIQWSCSVFTHMTQAACVKALETISKHAAKDGVQVNTWLVIDEMSKYSLQAKLADRSLPFDMGPFLTYSQENPLVCTAYKMEVVRELYRAAGLEITEFLPGSWRGYADNQILYQDIILSKKMTAPSN